MDVSWGEIISEIEKVFMTFVHAVLSFRCTCSRLLVHSAGAVIYYAALLPRRGRILRRTLSVCPSVCLSVPCVPFWSVTWRHLANYNDTLRAA